MDGPSLEEFKSRLPLADIIGRFVKLDRKGRELAGLCPFHQEKTPSFTVVEDKGFYYCFGCQARGNAIDFIMALEGLDFVDALERLSDITGIPAPRRRHEVTQARNDPGILEANAAAASFFADRLRSTEGSSARRYLAGRAVEGELIERFGLGLAPGGWHTLRDALTSKGFAEPLLLRAGLVGRSRDGQGYYDMFRGRIMFPIADARGRVIGFGARAMAADDKPKYLNTGETEVFHKGSILYNHHEARRPARDAGTVIAAEGYMDVIALARAGFAHAVAPLGTAVTEQQLELLWKLAAEPIFCFDGDRAGSKAAYRACERALPLLRPGRSLRFVLLADGEDPDSLLREKGREALVERFAQPVPMIDFLWNHMLAGRPVDTPERRAALRRDLDALAAKIGDRGLAFDYRSEFRQRFEEQFPRWTGRPRQPGDQVLRHGASKSDAAPAMRSGGALADPLEAAARRVLRPVLLDPALITIAEEVLGEIELPRQRHDSMLREILVWFAQTDRLDAAALRDHLRSYGYGELVDHILADGLFFGAHKATVSRSEAEGWVRTLSAFREDRALGQVRNEAAGDPAEIAASLAALDRLINGRDDEVE